MAIPIKKFNQRLESLKSERSSFIDHYKQLSDYHLGYRGRFLTSDRNKGFKRNTKQINNTSYLASRTLASGMMSGITPPSRPWFTLNISDPELREFKPVKGWIHRVEKTMYDVFAASNVYNSLHILYSELGVFGIGAMGVFDDFENVIHCQTYTVGSYMVAMNGKNQIDTFYREYEISVSQCVKRFGLENCSNTVKKLWDNGNTEAWVTIVHAIEPNDDRDMISPLSKDKAVRSVYYEKGADTQRDNKYLRESGFDEFPIMVPRWATTGEDIYGTNCPGMDTLGDTKSLQLGERRMYEGLDKIVSPPMTGPSSMKNSIGTSLRSNDISWHDSPSEGLKSIYDFRPDLGAVLNINDRVESRIQRGFYEDLFLMLANTDRREITAEEVIEKRGEKMVMLGPVLERLHSELLDPLIDVTYAKLERAGVFPPAPEELQGMQVKVDYVSVLAQAQRLAATSGLERVTGLVANMAGVWPEAALKINAGQVVDEMANSIGVPPSIIRTDEEVAAAQQAAAAQAAQEQSMMQGEALAKTAKTVSETDLSGDNALTAMIEQAQ